MKKTLLILAAMIVSLTLSAQSTFVYYGHLSKNTSLGFGLNGNDVILSLMEVNKSRNFDSFCLKIYVDGESYMKEDTIYHLELGGRKVAHQKDYKMTLEDYNRLKRILNYQAQVMVNGELINGAKFTGVLRVLEVEQKLFMRGKMQNVRKVSIWNWNHRSVEMMRFKLPNVKDFRYVRQTPHQ